MNIILSVIGYAVGMFILYIVIEHAVRNGINSSVIGERIEKGKHTKESFLEDDLDN